MTSLTNINGLSSWHMQRLGMAGVYTTEQLLERAALASDRMRLADEAQISLEQLEAWVQEADLLRVHGIGERIVKMLRQAGVTSSSKLAYRNPVALRKALQKVATKRRNVAPLPSLYEIEAYVLRAKQLPKLVRR